ncbi:unnamed protein product [Peniophora sp. CBMAI 1063]|nr:unnamed protein product [Peniophora sp. CBMAI 1063]
MPSHAIPIALRSSTGAKRRRGRPANTGAPQMAMVLENIGEYRMLKNAHAPQIAISESINKMARMLIRRYGWENPLKASTVQEGEEHDGGPVSEERQRRRDVILKKVRGEVKKIWRRNLLPAREAAAGQSTTEIANLIKLFATKPRQKQAYKIWAQSVARPDLEVEVDARHADRLREQEPGSAPLPRISTWNIVASERFKAASHVEQDHARREARQTHKQAVERWEQSASALPRSPQEAVKFMEESQLFLSDMMHFFASRSAGIAIMFIGGPGGSSLVSEGVCDVPGHPKLLYTEANPQGCAHFKYDLAKQVQILNEIRWESIPSGGNAMSDIFANGDRSVDDEDGGDANGGGDVENGKDRRGNGEKDQDTDGSDEGWSDEDAPYDVGMETVRGIEFLLPLSRALGGPEPRGHGVLPSSNNTWPYSDSGRTYDFDPVSVEANVTSTHPSSQVASREAALDERPKAVRGIELLLPVSRAIGGPEPREHGVLPSSDISWPYSDGGRTYDFNPVPVEANLTSTITSFQVASREAALDDRRGIELLMPLSRALGGPEPREHGVLPSSNTTWPYPDGGRTYDLDPVSVEANVTSTHPSSQVASREAALDEQPIIDGGMSSISYVGQQTQLTVLNPTELALEQHSMNMDDYKKALRTAISRVLPHKVWLEESNTINFLKALPSKLCDRIDVCVAYDLTLSYLRFEASNTNEMALTMQKVLTSDGQEADEKPRYMAELYKRDFVSRWNARADDNESRTPAKLDADVNATLTRQWALLQPMERLDAQGRICVPADASMDWRGRLAPGLDGVRLLVVTMLVWAWNIRGDEERTQWSHMAIDVSRVLRILVQQAGPRDADRSAIGHEEIQRGERKKSTRKVKKSAKLRELDGSA